MSEVSKINSKIRSFLTENQSLKNLPKSELLSIMTARGIISSAEASDYLKNSAFDTGYSNGVDVIPQWQGQKNAMDNSLNVLGETVTNARTKLDNQDKSEGTISRTINFLKETFDTENKKSNTENLIAETEKQISELEKSTSPEEFKAKFKKFRGVEFSPAKIELCREKTDEMNRTQSIKDTVDSLKSNLAVSTVNDTSNAGFRSANRAILKTFNALGIKNKNEVNKILKDIEGAHSQDDAIKKYGGDFRISKNKKGEYTIHRTDKSGYPAEATMEELQIIAQEMKFRLNKAYGAAIGAEIPENATNEEIEKLTAEKYSKTEAEYQTAFKEAYGEKNLTQLAENYIQSQKQNTAYVQTALDMASMAAMFLGSGVMLKGASLLTKGSMPLKTLTTATNVAAKVMPAVAAVQITKPVQLAENLTAEEPDWKAYGMGVAEGAMWMALGFATGAAGDKARLFLGQKGLSQVAKNTGKSIDDLITMYKSGHKLPKNLHRSLSLIENTAKISGTSAEFTADILATYAIQKARGEDLTFSDYVMSANGALMGTVMHKTFAQISDAEKVKVIQKSLLETNPKMSKAELEKASQTLLDLHRLAEEKRNPKTTEKLNPEELDNFEDNVLQLRQKAYSGNLKGLDCAKNLTAAEQKQFVKVLTQSGDLNDFLMTSVSEKPACWVECPKNFDASKLNTKDFEALIFDRKFDEVDTMILLNKKMVKSVIEETPEIYQKRLGLDEKSSTDEIYNALINDFKNGRDGFNGFKQDLLGMTLGFGRDNAMIFELERMIEGDVPALRKDINAYKQAIKEALYSDNSPYKDFSNEFKAGFAERIDEIKEIGNPHVPGYYSVDYSRSVYDQNIRIERLRSANKKLETVNDDSIVLTHKVTTADGKTKLEFNETGEKKAREAANEIHIKAANVEKAILKIMNKAGLGTAGVNMTHRPKSAQSLYDKIKNAICDPKHPSTFSEAIKSIKDAVGTRTELADFDYKKHPDIVEMYKKDPEKAIQMAAERQSEKYVQKVKEIIKNSAANPDAQIKALRLSNYMGKDGIPYFSEKQVAILQDYAAQYGIDLHIKNELTKVRASGYTALQMNFQTKDGFTFEWQLRGSKVNKFAECEHVPYDIREGKDITGGREFLKALYEPIEKIVKGLSPEDFDKYNEYLTAHYEHLRKQELGFDSKPPKLEDYGLTDTKLKAENLELLHEVSDKLKTGEIDEQTALWKYLAKTENKASINIPKNIGFKAPNKKFAETDDAFRNIVQNNKAAFKSISKIEDMDEFIRRGAALILDEMGLAGAPIKIEITDNLNEFSMNEATLRISRNWAGNKLKHIQGKGDRAEILGGIAHEMNHYLQYKEMYLNAMLREDEFKYNLEMSEECQNLMLWGLGADDIGSAKFPYPIEQSDFYFDKANQYMENFMNYVEPYKMIEVDGKMVYAKDENGQLIIDEKAYEAYLKQLIEAESFKRGDIVRDEYKKLINEQ